MSKLNLKTLTLGAVAMFALSSCDDISGTLRVDQPISAKDKKGKLLTLSPGSYSAQFELNDDGQELEMKVETGNGKKKIKMPVPAGSRIPTNGAFELRAQQTGQPFDLAGTITTSVAESQAIHTWESCRIDRWETVCGYRGCWNRPVSYWGQREVQYHTRVTTTSARAQIRDAQSSRASGIFDGQRQDQETIYDYAGYCY